MEEYETPDPDFVKGFNEGYTLAKHLPDLAEQLGKATGETQRGSGFQAGRQQAALDQERQRAPQWSRPDYSGKPSALETPAPDRDDRERSHEVDWEPER